MNFFDFSSITTTLATVLIVDDQVGNIQVLAGLLEMEGYSVSYALSAQEALKRLTVIGPDLILMDLFMPDVSGLELCQQIKSNPIYQEIPIIFVTASYDPNHIPAAFDSGAADYILKPFNRKELAIRVATHIQLRHKTLALHQIKDQIDTLNTILSHTQEGILILDPAGRIQSANPAAAQMLNQPLHTLCGSRLDPSILEQQDHQDPSIKILKSNGQPGFAQITHLPGEWNGRPASIVYLRELN
jgi:CheY-like chemotaxis protein